MGGAPAKSNVSTTFKGATIRGDGPPLKQARFSIDQHPGLSSSMGPMPSAEASAQMALSSLSSDTAIPAATATNGRPPITSSDIYASSTAKAKNATGPLSSSIKRAAPAPNGKHHAATTNPDKRSERNAREKERSCRIAKQIDDLRSLLSNGGVIVAKGTKSAVLSEAAEYINMLQQQQCQWEMDRQALIQQVQEVGTTTSMAAQAQAQAAASTS